jgi:CobQ-like glutamine amidotransferase family enzyme
MYKLKIYHLYPDLLNLYGDRGNIIALRRRCEWRSIEAEVVPVSIGDAFEPDACDILFIGGGQDYEQSILQPDLMGDKLPAIKDYILGGGVTLAICGGYQLLGKYYRTIDGRQLDFTGILDFYTVGGRRRMINNLAYQCGFVMPGTADGIIVGFENHSGKTYLGEGVSPLGRVLKGCGNNGEDHTEGVIFKNTVGTYCHGSLLPKNPCMTDYLLEAALRRRYPDFDRIAPLDDTEEEAAHAAALKMMGI